MSQNPFTPLAETAPEDAEFIAFLDLPQAKANVADDIQVREKLNEVWDTIRRIKSRRMELESEWLAIQRMTVLEHDEGKRYNGRSNAYLPVYARARKTLTSQIMKGLFPSDDYMDVVDRENGESDAAKAVKAVVQYEFETSARIRAMFKPFIGQFVDFGFGVMKRWYRTDRIVQPRRQRIAKGLTPKSNVIYDEGFTLSNRSVFNVVVYPEWAEEKRDLQIEAERLEIPTHVVNAMHASKRWLNVDEALNTGAGNDNFDWCNQQTLHDVSSIANVTEFRNKTGSPVESVIAVEAWCRLVLPKRLYAPEEDPNLPVPARVLFINGVPVVARRNNFYDQQSPYEYGRDNIIAGSFYGNGAGRLVRYLQYLSNDFANQINDVGIYGLNPVTLINTNYFAGAADALKPGKVYRVRDVEQAMKFVSPKVEIVQYGQTMLQQIITMTQDGSGAPPVLQGSKAASTATGSQLLSQNAMSPLQDTVEDIEAQVMVPLMKAAWSLAQQYRSKPFIRKMLGQAPMNDDGTPRLDPANGRPMPAEMEQVEILPADINIDCQFRFLASSQSNSRMARQQGLLAFAQLSSAMAPNLQMLNKMVNPEPILERAWTDGLGNRGFDKVIIPMPMPPMAPEGMGGEPQPPQEATQQPPAVDQAATMEPQDPMDEGTFDEVRQSTDAGNAMPMPGAEDAPF